MSSGDQFMVNLTFTWMEHAVFFGMIAASMAVGVYFGCFKKSKDTVAEYILGNKQMPVLPVALSLIASFVSGITLLGFPAEVYEFGTQISMNMVAAVVGALVHRVFFLPVLFHLQTNSIYEYLERRFNKAVRKLGSGVFAVTLLTYVPVVIYVPSLAFNQVTGIPVSWLAPIICGICVFYTILGGLRGVVWIDALQAFFTMGACFTVCFLGVKSAGGFAKVWEINQQGERLEMFNMDPSPFSRNTFWTVFLGSICYWIGMISIHPSSYQRFISIPSYNKALWISVIMTIGLIAIKSVSIYTGLVIYARYKDCDPLHAKMINKMGQIFPYYVMDVARDYPGLAGLFLSGVVSTALSTMSTGLNTVAGTLYEDFIRTSLPWKVSESQANRIIKLNVILLGTISTLLVFFVQHLGTVNQVAISLVGITKGTTLFVFMSGMCLPWLTSKGVLAGALASVVVNCIACFGAQVSIATGKIRFPGKITSIAGCSPNITAKLNLTTTTFGVSGVGTPVVYDEGVLWIFRISFWYYTLLGLLTGFVVAIIYVIFIERKDLEEVDPQLIFPQLRWLLPEVRPVKDADGKKVYHLVPVNDVNLKSNENAVKTKITS